MNYQIIGLIAGTITSAGFVPQLYKAYKSKQVEDISFLQPLVLSIGIFLWLIYGIMRDDIIIIMANTFALTCNILLLLFKIYYSKK